MENDLISTETYIQIREILTKARDKAYAAVNFAMVEAYWHIGKTIVEARGGGDRAEYGTRFIEDLSGKLTVDFGKGFTASNLRHMCLFYLTFPIRYALRSELAWTNNHNQRGNHHDR